MKIGIITFQQAINYGAVLQVYSLQRLLSDLNLNTKVINYISPKLLSDYRLVKFGKGFKAFVHSVISAIVFKKKKSKFDRFAKKYLNLTNSTCHKNELANLASKLDFVITGSDQVWNYEITNHDTTYLLDFVEPQKRLSYAASFGVSTIPKELQQRYSELLKGFKYITVRERQGADLVRKLCNEEVPVVLDPTLLLKKSDWEEIVSNLPVPSKKIVVYTLSRSDLLMNIADALSKETGLEIAVLNPRLRNIFSKTSAYTSGPDEFINLFMNAEYVLTNSFHGTAFAINFNKKFLVELPDGERGKLNSRIENILELSNLKDRYVNTMDLNKMYADIDWDNVNYILDIERNKSFSHLKLMIGKNE